MSASSEHPVFSRLWPALSARLDAAGGAQHRRDLVSGLEGSVVEVGCGDGRLFAYYPRTVSELLAIEPESRLFARAAAAAALSPVPTTVVAGSAARLPLEDASVDAAVCSLVLCSVPDQAEALAEIRRVLRPGGQLRFYEHVVAEPAGGAAVQRFLDRSRLWPTLAAGCHMARDTTTALTDAGFAIEEWDRFTFPRLGMPHVLGRARRVS